MQNFSFNPPTGLLDPTVFATNPQTEQDAREQLQTPLDQLKDFINSTIVDFFNRGGVINGEVTTSGINAANNRVACGTNFNDPNGNTSITNSYSIVWGSTTLTSGTGKAITFSSPFTSSCYSVVATIKGSTAAAVSVNNISKTGFTALQNSGSSLDINYIAIGY